LRNGVYLSSGLDFISYRTRKSFDWCQDEVNLTPFCDTCMGAIWLNLIYYELENGTSLS